MIKRILFWLGNSRLFSAPMTIMSWLVVFLYALNSQGNILNGVLALIGILFAHLATNLFDDYVDYRNLSANKAFSHNESKTKCLYLINGDATLTELLKVVIIYCSIAFVIGVILTFRCGYGVILLSVIGGLITLSYARLSSNGFSEIAVGTAFGPLLFEGVYYVMCYKFSYDVLIISLGIVTFTVGLVYMNNLLDFDSDMESGKKSICCRIGKINSAINVLLAIFCFGYLNFICYAFIKMNFLYLLPLLTLPLAIEIWKSAKLYYQDKFAKTEIKWWYYPLENWNKIRETKTAGFYLRLFMTRNLMIWVSFLFIFSLLLDY